jgi:murein DD-endopeptidase MepM/ murein hydrolase activator NlpD
MNARTRIDLNQQIVRSSAKVLILLLAVWIAFMSTISKSASAQEEGPVYIVQPGDTLYSIALQFGTTIDLLSTVNGISDPSLISPGMRLIIPGFEAVDGVLDLRTIQFGETLSSLSKRYGIPSSSIARLNRILNPERLYIGQSAILSIPESEVPQERLLLSPIGETALTFSIWNNLNPWTLHTLDESIDRLWLLPNEALAVGVDSDQTTSGLPIQVKSVQVSPDRAVQGRTLAVTVQLRSLMEISGSIGERELHFHTPQALERLALQGIHALIEPGVYDLQLSFSSGDSGEHFDFVQPLRIASGDYYFDPVLYVPPETIDPQYTQPENEFISSLVNAQTEEQYWVGSFSFPSTNVEIFPSVFGSRRNYNDSGYTSYHTGLDFYGGIGTNIYSPAAGVVVFAGTLDVRGNVTFIDHGWGILTGYLHQSEILVSMGDRVEVGDVIGKVGATGRVTGPHLHWEVWVGGVPVNPLEWTSGIFPLPSS